MTSGQGGGANEPVLPGQPWRSWCPPFCRGSRRGGGPVPVSPQRQDRAQLRHLNFPWPLPWLAHSWLAPHTCGGGPVSLASGWAATPPCNQPEAGLTIGKHIGGGGRLFCLHGRWTSLKSSWTARRHMLGWETATPTNERTLSSARISCTGPLIYLIRLLKKQFGQRILFFYCLYYTLEIFSTRHWGGIAKFQVKNHFWGYFKPKNST